MSEGASRIDVLLITYNHERYVRRALESVASQIISGRLTVVVADDCSTDGTMRVIRQFADDCPSIDFRFLDSDSNLGVTRNYQRAFAACEAEYVAVLEGDDYWISPHKLATQRDFLDVRMECDLCSNNYYVFEEGCSRFTPRWAPGPGHMLLGARELIADNVVGNFSTCMYRTSALRSLPAAVFEHKSYDWIINIIVARTSLIAFLHEPMSVYRLHGESVWSVLPAVEKLQTQRDLIDSYDQLTDGVFASEFAALRARLDHVIEQGGSPTSPGVMGAVDGRTRIRDWLPPFVVPLARWMVPVAMRRGLRALVSRGRA